MAPKDLPDLGLLRQFLTYNPEDGSLTWRARGPEYFPHGRYGPESTAQGWNTRCAGKRADNPGSGYRRISLSQKIYPAHRVAWALHHGYYPIGQIDHINGDKCDNRISNLRDVSPSLNSRNVARKVVGKSGHIGVVAKANGRFQVYVSRIAIGTYDTLEMALVARNAAWKALGMSERHGTEPIVYGTGA